MASKLRARRVGKSSSTYLAWACHRVEVGPPAPTLRGIVTNPIYVRGAAGQRKVERREASGIAVMDVDGAGVIEKDAESSATLGGESGSRILKFRLRPGERVSQYAAFAIPLAQDPPELHQWRLPGGRPHLCASRFNFVSKRQVALAGGIRSHVAGGTRDCHTLDRLIALDRPGQSLPGRGATSLLFVVDLTNAAPGLEGEFEISSLRLARC